MSSRRFVVEIFIRSQKASRRGCEESGKLDLEVLVMVPDGTAEITYLTP